MDFTWETMDLASVGLFLLSSQDSSLPFPVLLGPQRFYFGWITSWWLGGSRQSFLKNIFDRIGTCEKLRLWRAEERKEPEAVEDVLKKIKGKENMGKHQVMFWGGREGLLGVWELEGCMWSRRRKWQPTPMFLPGESQGWGSLVGCCLWGGTESDTTEAT